MLFKRCQERIVTSNFANLIINFLKNHKEYDGEREREREREERDRDREIESLHEREKHYERKNSLI